MPKFIILVIISFIFGFILRDLTDGVKICGWDFYKVNKLDFTKDGYNELRDFVVK